MMFLIGAVLVGLSWIVGSLSFALFFGSVMALQNDSTNQ